MPTTKRTAEEQITDSLKSLFPPVSDEIKNHILNKPQILSQFNEAIFSDMSSIIRTVYIDYRLLRDFQIAAASLQLMNEDRYNKFVQRIPLYNKRTIEYLPHTFSDLIDRDSFDSDYLDHQKLGMYEVTAPYTSLFFQLPIYIDYVVGRNLRVNIKEPEFSIIINTYPFNISNREKQYIRTCLTNVASKFLKVGFMNYHYHDSTLTNFWKTMDASFLYDMECFYKLDSITLDMLLDKHWENKPVHAAKRSSIINPNMTDMEWSEMFINTESYYQLSSNFSYIDVTVPIDDGE